MLPPAAAEGGGVSEVPSSGLQGFQMLSTSPGGIPTHVAVPLSTLTTSSVPGLVGPAPVTTTPPSASSVDTMPIAAVGNNFRSVAAVVTNDSQLAAVDGARSQPIVLQAQNSQPSSFATTSTTPVGQSAFTSSVPVSSGQVVILQ